MPSPSYYRRIFAAYLTGRKSHLTFWHGTPAVNEEATVGKLGQYYMPFVAKADYPGDYDERGIPMLDYRGAVGVQYNPIAIAQYGLGNYNLYKRHGEEERRAKFLRASDWLVENLEENSRGVWVWNHNFDWEYRDTLKGPWYSALSQGQGISLLVRAVSETGDEKYADAAARALVSFETDIDDGGVTYTDDDGNIWFEETIVDPPTHILNGFLWASWGLFDYQVHGSCGEARDLFDRAVVTMKANLRRFDTGFWSLYEQSGTRLKMMASRFYHSLHVVQLRIMNRLTGESMFNEYAEKWDKYQQGWVNRNRALVYKAAFKLLYY